MIGINSEQTRKNLWKEGRERGRHCISVDPLPSVRKRHRNIHRQTHREREREREREKAERAPELA